MKTKQPRILVRSSLLLVLVSLFLLASFPLVSWALSDSGTIQTVEQDTSDTKSLEPESNQITDADDAESREVEPAQTIDESLGFVALAEPTQRSNEDVDSIVTLASPNVSDEQGLIDALADATIPIITVEANIELTVQHTIDRSVTLVGANGATLTAASGQLHFTIDYTGASLDVSFEDLTFEASGTIDTSAHNGGILAVRYSGNNALALSIDNCTFTGLENYDQGVNVHGGAINFSTGGGSLTVANSLFTNNYVNNGTGGAINIQQSVPSTVSNSTFSGNSANSGGAFASGGNASFQGCYFTGNSAGADGGAVRVFMAFGATLTVDSSTFANNSSRSGGALYNLSVFGGSNTIQNSTFANNTAGDDGASGLTGLGGAAWLSGDSVIRNCTIVGNTIRDGATDSIGAGIVFEEGYNYTHEANLIIANTQGGVEQSLGTCGSTIASYVPITTAAASILALGPGETLSDYVKVVDASASVQVAELAMNGGQTPTIMLADASPAIDYYAEGEVALPLLLDQRGSRRPFGLNRDAGALEVQQRYTVTFEDWDGTVLSSQLVEGGLSAKAPADPTRSGYTFTGWSNSYDAVTGNVTTTALYTKNADPVTPVAPDDSNLPQTGDAGVLAGTAGILLALGGVLLVLRKRVG